MAHFGSKEYFFEIAKGNITGHSHINKFGMNSEVDTGDTYDIWELGTDTLGVPEYTWPSSAETMNISSSTDADSGATYLVTIEGLDANWVLQSTEVQLTGWTPVAASGTWIRVFRMYSTGSSSTAGNVYAANTATGTLGNNGVPTALNTVRSYFSADGQQTLQALFSIPANTTGYIAKWWTSILGAVGASQTITAEILTRNFGMAFRVKQSVDLSSDGGPWQYEWLFPDPVPAQSDIVIHVHDASTINMSVSGGFDIILVDD